MKCYLLCTRRRRIGVRILCISPNIISSWNTFCDLGSHYLQTLFYQFYKMRLNFIKSDRRCMTQHLSGSASVCNVRQVWQTANLGKDNENAEPHALIPVTDIKWFGSRSASVSRVWPESNCLHVISSHQRERNKSRWMSMYVCIYMCQE